jgi:polysaccharide export outer membrane protein
MNLLFPRYSTQTRSRVESALAVSLLSISRSSRMAKRCGLTTFSLLAVSTIFWAAALGHPQAASAQGSQPALPAPRGSVAPESVVAKTKIEEPKAEATRVDAPKDVPASPAGGTKAATPSVGGKSYIIGPNDVLSVSVWNQPQISRMVDVHLDGMISLPLVGEVRADGLTAIQLKDELTRRLGEVLTEPNVDVSVVKINSKHYGVYGAVLRGGKFPLVESITIMDALELAVIKDGFAKTNKIELRRGKEKFMFNYKDFIKGKNMDKNINRQLQDADEIIVPE